MISSENMRTSLSTIALCLNALIFLEDCHHGISNRRDIYSDTFETTAADCVQAAGQSFPFVPPHDLYPYCTCVLNQAGVSQCQPINPSDDHVSMNECFNSKYLITNDSPTATKLTIAKIKESCISQHLGTYNDKIPAAIRKGVFEGQKRIILDQFSKTSLDSKKKELYVSCIINTYLDDCQDKTYSGYLICLNNENELYLTNTVKKCRKYLH